MIKEKIRYIDFDDQEKEEDLYFNLTAVELADIEVKIGDTLPDFIKTIIFQDKDGKVTVPKENNEKVWDLFKLIISKAYGEKTTEGRFVKNNEIRDSFLATEAFSQLFLRLITDRAEAEKFFTELAKVKTTPVSENKQ